LTHGKKTTNRLSLDLEADEMDFGITDVFDAMRRQALEPVCWRQRHAESSAVEKDTAVAIAADEKAEHDGVVDGGPAMGMHWNGVADRDAGVENAHPIVFKNQPVMSRRGDERIEFGRIRPGGHGRVR
jgi:hypothetical protein